MAATAASEPGQPSDETQRLLRTLHKSDYESERRRIPPRAPGSCQWFLQEPLYRSWKEEPRSSFLWLSGPLGSGKSVLASYLIDQLRSEESQKELSGTVCYFFFNASNKDHRSPSSALCAILHQLFTQRDHQSQLIQHALNEFRTRGRAFTEQFTSLWRTLASVMADPLCGNVLCIIDGLSECQEAARVPFINSMARFYSDREADETKGSLLKIIATTRIELKPSSASLKRLEKIKMKSIVLASEKDHCLFIEARVQRISLVRGFSKKVQAKLINDLLSTQEGTFLAISLVLDWLEHSPVDSNDNPLQSLNISDNVNTVSDVYEISLSHCPDNRITKRLLHIVAAAAEPLTLEEIDVAMAVQCSAEPNNKYEEVVTVETIKRHCGILLRIVDTRVVFVHQTAKEFLIKPAHDEIVSFGKWKYVLDPVESNKVLAEICVSFLSKPNFNTNSLVVGQDVSRSNIELRIKDYTSRHVLLEYAAKHWAEHFMAANEPLSLVELVASLCDPPSDRFRTWFQVYWNSAHPPTLPPGGITNLMVDSHFGHLSVLNWRQKGSFDVRAKDERGWTALHWAAQAGNFEVVEAILELNPDLDAQTHGQQRTAMDLAAGSGYESIVQLLLDSMTRNPITTARVISNASAKPGTPSRASPQTRRLVKSLPTTGIEGVRSLILIGAAQEGNEVLVRKLLDQGVRSNQTNDRGLTALHVAAYHNHVSIVQILLEKGRADIDRRSDSGETALALASAKGHKTVVQLLLSRGANTGSHDLGGNTPFSLADESVKGLLERPPIVRGPSLVPRPPSPPPLIPEFWQAKDKTHPTHDFRATILDLWSPDASEENFHEERSQFANPTVHNLLYGEGPNAIMAPLCQGPTPTTPTFRWLHLPANNLIWVKDLVTKIYHERIAEPGKLRPSHFEAKLKRVNRLFDAGQQYRAPKDSAVHARFFRPSCRGVNIGESTTAFKSGTLDAKMPKGRRSESKLPSDDTGKDETASKDNDVVLFMPFLHYETDAGRESIAKAVESARQSGLSRKTPKGKELKSADERLIHAYLHEKPFMHVRRTLDQYYYHTMKDTKQRDRDQVVFRWAKRMWPDDPDSVHNILMVDQLWLWILDGDTVITSFPQRWNRKHSEDDLDVVESLKKHIQLREGRDPLRSAYDLAVLIASFCSEVFFEREDAPEPLDERLQFLEFFDKSIGHVTASETACFDRLANFFKDIDNKSREEEGIFIDAIEKEVEDDSIDGPTDLNTSKPYDVFYNIGDEAALLREIKDIRDELNIITKVFVDQQKALETMHKLVRVKVSFKGKEPSSDIIRRIKRHMSDIKEIDDHASRTYEALNHLLDLKQKHANVCEARWTREQAQETAKQSNTIMVFTIVTIIFLPLSFMTAFFALNIVQFPKDPQTGVLALELSYVARYLLGVSGAIIVPFLLIAFNVNRLNRYLRKWFGQFQETGLGTGLTLWTLKRLGRLTKERKAILLGRRKNKLKRHEHQKEERQKKAAVASGANPAQGPGEKSAMNGYLGNNGVLSEKVSGDVNGSSRDGGGGGAGFNSVLSWRSSESAYARQRLATIDEESQARYSKPSKAMTYPLMKRSRPGGGGHNQGLLV